ncbi:TPA: hypothetical protein OGU83_004366 [Escherichia coli]|uniref:hypothetical protein n=3 Tax=Escherichia coli TaxID=562 RepID=UPI0018E48A0A|nr:hypothetical protein [Escherichia coli]EMC8318526.1 hypothetical protein [Escherichia coli]MCV2201072.1 hypothetical protein [Escherichia coli]HCQ0836509.1 hypothetical protein [Escherichia coli]HDW8475450.1 hypothetical protein [Escherichia coli]
MMNIDFSLIRSAPKAVTIALKHSPYSYLGKPVEYRQIQHLLVCVEMVETVALRHISAHRTVPYSVFRQNTFSSLLPQSLHRLIVPLKLR